jgi:hypothetical protein
VAELASSFLQDGLSLHESIKAAVKMALPTRIEIEREADSDQSHAREVQKILDSISQQALGEGDLPEKKN